MSLTRIQNWKNYPNFSFAEFNKHNLQEAVIAEELVEGIQFVRDVVKEYVIINEGYAESGHAEKSYHYKGRAADLRIQNNSLIEMALAFYKYTNFSIGLYPEWNNPGLHVDTRIKQVFWIKVNGIYSYNNSFGNILETTLRLPL